MLDNPAAGAEPSKRKRRPAGTPDPSAEVVALSPETLLESDRYVCEICNQGFQREQNLQMHRRRHKVPWKLVKRESPEVKKRVFVCPEPSCLHHQPSHALGDLVGIKKHFRRKHSNHKHWLCHRCNKAYAVQSDYKAHLKTCGTRGHSCDCGRVFSRVESFIEHQDSCTVRTVQAACSSRTASSTSPSSEANFTRSTLLAGLATPRPAEQHHNVELQLLPSSCRSNSTSHNIDEDLLSGPCLKLSIGSAAEAINTEAARVREEAGEQLRMAVEARREAKKQVEAAEVELAAAQRMRREAQAEVDKAEVVREQACKRVSSILMEITCHACRKHFHASAAPDETSLAVSYLSD